MHHQIRLVRILGVILFALVLSNLLLLPVWAKSFRSFALDREIRAGASEALLVTPGLTFTVNITDDGDDGACDGSHCSLREAINAANALSDIDTIDFDIPGAGPHSIQPLSALPVISNPVVIDGLSEPDFVDTPVIELDGSLAGSGVNGLEISAGDSRIQGLLVNRFDGDGLVLSVKGGNVIQGNVIGTNITGTLDLGNQGAGISINSPFTNTIGGTTSGTGNSIAYNGSAGVVVFSGTGHAVRGNMIVANEGLGIDLAGDGVTTNDADDLDSGPNHLQNFPVLSSAIGGNNTTIAGTLDSAVNTVFALDFFANDACDASDHGEGQIFLGSETTTTDSSGLVAFTVNLSATTLSGQFVTATATDPDGNSSEFSQCLAVQQATYTVNTSDDANGFCTGVHCSLREAIKAANAGSGADTIAFNIPGAGPHTIEPTSTLPTIVNPVTIDGTTQPGFAGTPIIEISGSQADEGDDGLVITGGNSTIRGLALLDIPGYGLYISDNGGNVIQGNIIQGSLEEGIVIAGTSNNIIGGATPGLGNTIAENDYGVAIVSRGSPLVHGLGNLIQGNAILHNGQGIDLSNKAFTDGVTFNDAGDTDEGGNHLQNFPVLTEMAAVSNSVTIEGSLNSRPNTLYTLDFYANTDCNFPFHGEGETFIGSDTVTTNGDGDVSFTVSLSATVPAGQFITATATDPNNNTSEFSVCEPDPAPDTTPPTVPPNPLTKPKDGEVVERQCEVIDPGTIKCDDITFIWPEYADLNDAGRDGKIAEYEGKIQLIPPESKTGLAIIQPTHVFTTAQTIYTPTVMLADGVYSWTIRAIDAAGNISDPAPSQTFTLRSTVLSGAANIIYLPIIRYDP